MEKEITISDQSILSPRERAEYSALPSKEGKKAFLVNVKGLNPNSLKVYDGREGYFDDSTNTFHPVNPEGFQASDIASAIPKTITTIGQIGGGIGGAALGSLVAPGAGTVAGEIAGAGAGGALGETAAQKLAIADIKARTGKDLGQYFSPKEVAKEAAWGAGGQAVGIGIGKLAGKLLGKGSNVAKATAITDENSLPVSKILAEHTGLQDGTIDSIAKNPYVQKQAAKGHIVARTEEFEKQFNKALQNTKPEIKRIQSKFYSDAGITDNTPISITKIIQTQDSPVPMTTIDKIDDSIKRFAETASTQEDMKALRDVKNIYGNIVKSSQNGALPFGTIKKYTQKLYSNAENAYDKKLSDIGQLFDSIRKPLTDARNSVPGIANASEKFKGLAQAQDLMDDLLRLSNNPNDLNVAKKLIRRYKDLGNTEFKNQIDSIENFFGSNPETVHLTDLTDKLKTYLMGIDVTKAKGNPFKDIKGIGGLPIVKQAVEAGKKIANPERITQSIAKLAQKGYVSPEKFAAKIPMSENILFGKAITGAKAYRSLLPKSKIASSISDFTGKNIGSKARTLGTQSITRLIRGDNQ